MIYIDTNIFVYAIENHPKYGASCKKILTDIMNKKIDSACSVIVLAELLNVLVRMRKLTSGKLDVKKSMQAIVTGYWSMRMGSEELTEDQRRCITATVLKIFQRIPEMQTPIHI